MSKLLKYPNEILSSKSEDVSFNDAVIIDKELREEMKNLKWGIPVGLAAPQIGHNKRVFVAMDKTYINPRITFRSPQKIEYMEGCYSLKEDKFDYKVARSYLIKMEWLDIRGKKRNGTFKGFDAQVIQHEYDHLEGKLCSHG